MTTMMTMTMKTAMTTTMTITTTTTMITVIITLMSSGCLTLKNQPVAFNNKRRAHSYLKLRNNHFVYVYLKICIL